LDKSLHHQHTHLYFKEESLVLLTVSRLT